MESDNKPHFWLSPCPLKMSRVFIYFNLMTRCITEEFDLQTGGEVILSGAISAWGADPATAKKWSEAPFP